MHEFILRELARQRVEELVRYADDRRGLPPRAARAFPVARSLAAWLRAPQTRRDASEAAACR